MANWRAKEAKGSAPQSLAEAVPFLYRASCLCPSAGYRQSAGQAPAGGIAAVASAQTMPFSADLEKGHLVGLPVKLEEFCGLTLTG